MRDQEIACVLYHRADEKRRVTEDTTNVPFYAYAVPCISERHLRDGLTIAAETMSEFGNATIEGIKIV